jgi:hypothetical protein
MGRADTRDLTDTRDLIVLNPSKSQPANEPKRMWQHPARSPASFNHPSFPFRAVFSGIRDGIPPNWHSCY